MTTFKSKLLSVLLCAAVMFCCLMLLSPKASAASVWEVDSEAGLRGMITTGASDGDTIKLTANITMTSEASTAANANSFTLDLNNYTITGASGITVIAHNGTGTLTITDSSTGKTGAIKHTDNSGFAIRNGSAGKIVVTGGTVSTSSTYASSAAINNSAGGTVTVSGGTVSATSVDGNASAIYNNGTGTIEVKSGGTVSTAGKSDESAAIYNNAGGTVTVSGGNVTATHTAQSIASAICNKGVGKIEVSGGVVVTNNNGTNSAAIYNNASGTVDITGGTVKTMGVDSSAVINKTGTVNISGDSTAVQATDTAATGKSNAVWNIDGGTVNITGGTVSTASESADSFAVWNYYGAANISKGSGSAPAISASNTASTSQARAIINGPNTGAVVTISGGTVEAKGGGANAAAICNHNGTVTISEATGSTTVSMDCADGKGKAVNNANNGIVNISGGTVETNSNDSASAAIYNSSGTINVSGGTIDSSGSGAYAVYFDSKYTTSTRLLNLSIGSTATAPPVIKGAYAAYGAGSGLPAPTVAAGLNAVANTAYNASSAFVSYAHASVASYKYITLSPTAVLTGGSASFAQGGAAADAVFTIGGGMAGFNATANYDHTEVGGATLSAAQVTAADGSIILAFAKSYLNTLPVGTTVAAVTLKGAGYAGMTAPVTFTVTSPASGGSSSGRENPSTGVSHTGAAAGALLLLAGAAAVLIKRKSG